jgi:hypothetical protein
MKPDGIAADSQTRGSWLKRKLDAAPQPVLVCYAALAAFATYFCMYAFRRPFAVATFEGESFLGSAVALKTAIVISQIIGYALSKYIGIKVCSEVEARQRAPLLILLILWAELALVVYGLVPDDFKVLAIFLNGLSLGMVWGLVVRYLEGRRTSELLLAALSCSYIVSSGVVKDAGRAILHGDAAHWWRALPGAGQVISGWMSHIGEGWMPAVTGLHFLPMFLIAVWLLQALPEPSAADIAERVQRQPMSRGARLAFLRRFLLPLVLLCTAYLFVTAYRDFRDSYQVEILDALGYAYELNKTIISQTEALVALGVMVAMALLNLVADNRRGLVATFSLMIAGIALLGVGTVMLQMRWIDGFWWMTLTGLGSYLAYVPFGAVLFDRLIASTRVAGTAVFGINLADSVGYAGSVGVQLFHDLTPHPLTRLAFLEALSYFMCLVGIGCLLVSCLYFSREGPREVMSSALQLGQGD